MALTTKVLTPREIARGAFLFGQAFARNEQFPNQGEFEGFYGAAYDASDSGNLHAKGALYLVYIGASCWASVSIGLSYLRRLMASLA